MKKQKKKIIQEEGMKEGIRDKARECGTGEG
jgi:BRCT domain type II-containing protein